MCRNIFRVKQNMKKTLVCSPVAQCAKLNWSTNNKAPVAAPTKPEAQWRCNLLFVTRLQEKD